MTSRIQLFNYICAIRGCLSEATVYAGSKHDAQHDVEAMGWRIDRERPYCPAHARRR